LLVFLAAPARFQTLKIEPSRFKAAPKPKTKPESEQSTLQPPSRGGPLEIRLDKFSLRLSAWLKEAPVIGLSSAMIGKFPRKPNVLQI